MEILRQTLLFLHFIGLAALLGGFFVQLTATEKRVVPAMLHGALTQLVTGVLLVGVNEGLDDDVNNAKIGVKLLVLVAILVVTWRGRRTAPIGSTVFAAIGALTVLNIGVAVFWT